MATKEMKVMLDELYESMFNSSSPPTESQTGQAAATGSSPHLGSQPQPAYSGQPMEFTFGIKIVVYSKNQVYPVSIWPLSAPRPKYQKPKPAKPTTPLTSEKGDTDEII
jgi:hypothetical protein